MSAENRAEKKAYYWWEGLNSEEIKAITLRLSEFPEYDNGHRLDPSRRQDDFKVIFFLRGKNHPPERSSQLIICKKLDGNWTVSCDQEVFEIIQDVVRSPDP